MNSNKLEVRIKALDNFLLGALTAKSELTSSRTWL